MKSVQCCPSCPTSVAALLVRISFGLAVALIGFDHYLNMQGFSMMLTTGLGSLYPLGLVWAYVLPGLLVVGGALLAYGANLDMASWFLGIALGSIVVGMLLKTVIGGIPLGEMMPAVNNTLIWMLVYMMTMKMVSCGKERK